MRLLSLHCSRRVCERLGFERVLTQIAARPAITTTTGRAASARRCEDEEEDAAGDDFHGFN
nr:hypothetical protein [Verrucomicrobiota bacterium]